MTGASGFLGSWICRVLTSEHRVFALVQESSNLYNLHGIKNIDILKYDSSEWPQLFDALSPSTLILCDWWGVANSYRNSLRQFENVTRMQYLVEAAVNSKISNVIGVGSQAELGPISNDIYESQTDGPTTKYGEAKVAARKALFTATENTDTRAIWMRIFSTYGPLDYGRWLLPDTINSLALGKSMNLTLGEQEWSYLHAYDLARAFLKIANNANISGIVNVGNPETATIREVTKMIGEYFDRVDLLQYGALPYRHDQVMRMKPICETLTNLGWKPEVSIFKGIVQTIEWNLGLASNSTKFLDSSEVTLGIPKKIPNLPQHIDYTF